MEIKGTVQTTNNIDGTVASTRQISGTTNHSPIRWVDGEEVAELIEPVVREVIEGMALDSDVVLNASNVEGSTVTAALNKLAEGVTPASLTTDDITNLSDIEGTNVTNALNSIDTILDQNDTDIENLKTNKADKSEIPNVPEWALAENKPSYNSDEITNSSDVSGTTVSGALNQLNQNLSDLTKIGVLVKNFTIPITNADNGCYYSANITVTELPTNAKIINVVCSSYQFRSGITMSYSNGKVFCLSSPSSVTINNLPFNIFYTY